MKTLVIAEKPSVGRELAAMLHCQQKGNGFIEGKDYVVTWGLGHLVTLQDPEDYDKKYKEWKLEHLPMMPQRLETTVIRQTAKQFGAVKAQLHRKDISDVVIATDAGREGELVARWILQRAGNQKPCRRLWISSVTEKAIREGFQNLKPAAQYDNLYRAALARAEADWLVGINATRALTCRYNAQLSCGRVQTPTLAMIAAREEEIRSFVPQCYYGLSAQANGIIFTWRDAKSGSTSSFSKERMEELMQKLKGKELRITEAARTEKRVSAPLLYDLTELQRDANKKFGFSAKETLNIMQRLYENHKVLTYPRTDSRYLTQDMVGTLHERLDACGTGPYRALAARAKQQKIGEKPSFVNNAKVSDHHAIIPTEQFVQLQNMTAEERKIYDLVVRRFISVFYPQSRYEATTLKAQMGQEMFAARGKVLIDQGWMAAYDHAVEEEEETGELKELKLPRLERGEVFSGVRLKISEGRTNPPARFTEAALLAAMENPVKYMESRNAEMEKTLGATGGLGTVATRADIIEKLFSSFLLEKKGKEIYTTAKAKQLLKLVPRDLKRPELTADWEMKLSKISKGQLNSDVFLRDIREYTTELLSEIKTADGTFRHENLTGKKCPQCGKRLLAVNGKNAKLLVCQDRECGYRETVSHTTNARCPVCHKKMEMTGKGQEAAFICSCGHRERLDKFQERRAKEGGGVSKKDVNRYLQKQKKEVEAPINNAFAEALLRMKQ